MANTKPVQHYVEMGLEDYMTKRVEDQIGYMENKSASSKRKYQTCKLIVIILSVSIPFLVTLIDVVPYFKYLVAAVGVIIAAIEGTLSLFDYQNHWVNYRQTLESLQREKMFFATKSSIYRKDSSFQFFVERVETLLTTENNNWSENALNQVELKEK